MKLVRLVMAGVFFGTLPLISGCGGGDQIAEVTGVVTLDGKPLELVAVEFWPEIGMRSFGKTDNEGKFTLQLDDRSRPGAYPGTHKVSLKDTWHMADDYISEGGDWVDMSAGRKSRIDSKYFDAPMSPLTVQVKLGEVNHFEFEVEKRK